MAGSAWRVNSWEPNAWRLTPPAWAQGQDIPLNRTTGTAITIPALPYSTSQNVHSTDTGLTYEVFYRVNATRNGNISVSWARTVTAYVPLLTVLDRNSRVVSGLLNRPPSLVTFRAKKGQYYYLRFTPNAGNPTPAVLTLTVQ